MGGAHMVKWVKPTGDMTPARPETAARLRNTTQAMKRVAAWLGVKLALVRIEQCKHQWLGWPIATTTATSAVTGARPAMVWAMPSKGGAVVSRVRLMEVR